MKPGDLVEVDPELVTTWVFSDPVIAEYICWGTHAEDGVKNRVSRRSADSIVEGEPCIVIDILKCKDGELSFVLTPRDVGWVPSCHMKHVRYDIF
jgi:hypothetical protein